MIPLVVPIGLPFHFVDVFAVEPLTGNPLVVVEDAADLPHELLQRIAREFNQSETTFLLPPTRPAADWRLRSFTPAGIEVFGAGGHNTLGAWWWLAEAGKLALNGRMTVFQQEIGDRVLPVTIAETDGRVARVEMDQQPPAPAALRRSRRPRGALGVSPSRSIDRPCAMPGGVDRRRPSPRPDPRSRSRGPHSAGRGDLADDPWKCRRARLLRVQPRSAPPRGDRRTHDSSIRRSASRKIPPQAQRRDRWPPIWWPMAWPGPDGSALSRERRSGARA